MTKENGAIDAPLDDAAKAKAESRYPAYYEYFAVEEVASTQGTAPFQ